MYRYRLIDEDTGADLGPFVSLRLTFAEGEPIPRSGVDGWDAYEVASVIDAENEDFRAYLVVRRQSAAA